MTKLMMCINYRCQYSPEYTSVEDRVSLISQFAAFVVSSRPNRIPDSSKIFLDRRFGPVYFALKAKVKAFYHIARTGIFHFIVVPVLNIKFGASSSAIQWG